MIGHNEEGYEKFDAMSVPESLGIVTNGGPAINPDSTAASYDARDSKTASRNRIWLFMKQQSGTGGAQVKVHARYHATDYGVLVYDSVTPVPTRKLLKIEGLPAAELVLEILPEASTSVEVFISHNDSRGVA